MNQNFFDHLMGEKVIAELVAATGLPAEPIIKELRQLIVDSGKDVNAITLDELRPILALYLLDVFAQTRTVV